MATIKNDECKQNSLNIYSVNNSQNKTFHLTVQIVMHVFSDSLTEYSFLQTLKIIFRKNTLIYRKT